MKTRRHEVIDEVKNNNWDKALNQYTKDKYN
jgi:hypothetical protein